MRRADDHHALRAAALCWKFNTKMQISETECEPKTKGDRSKHAPAPDAAAAAAAAEEVPV